MKIGCVILNYNDAGLVLSLVERIRGYDALDAIILVDNSSTDDSWQTLQAAAGGKLFACRTPHNGGYGFGNNFGVRYAKEHCGCDHVLIANPDVEFSETVVERFAQALREDDRRAAVSAMQCNGKGERVSWTAWRVPTPWHYIFSTGKLLKKWGANYYYPMEELCALPVMEAECVSGSLLMVSVDKFLACGGYDEDMFLYCEETTLGYKLKHAGYISVICSDTDYLHLHGVSISKSVSSAVRRKKLLLESHHLFLKRYLQATPVQLAADRLVGWIVLLEEMLKTLIKR